MEPQGKAPLRCGLFLFKTRRRWSLKIFNRGNDSKATSTALVAPVAAPASAPPSASPTAAPAPAAAPAAPASPDLAVILDANVKEMSEKIARLASTLESSQHERTSFEAKIEMMEERMRKLSSLTEMISAQYNPFVGDAPSEHAEMPRPEVGLAPPPLPASAGLPPPPSVEADGLSLSLGPPAPHAPAFDDLPPLDEPPAPAPSYEAAVPALSAPEPVEPGVYLWSCSPGFESSMLLLGWSDMLLKTAGSREALLELVNYYHNVGWIGDPARDQLLAYSDGLAAPGAAPTADWRTSVEVHEKSLLFVEKLRAVSRRQG